MKIMFIAAADSIHTVRWVNSLVKHNIEVHLVYLPNHRNKYEEISDEVILHELKYPGSKGYYLNAFQLRKLIRDISPDVINAHYASGYGTLLRWSRSKCSMLSVWGSDVYLFPYESKIKMHIIRKNLMYPKFVASTSKVMANQANSLLKNDREFFITPFGVDTAKFDVEPCNDKKCFRIVCIKSLKEVYGIEYLIEAIDLLCKKLELEKCDKINNKIICEIYGDGKYESVLTNKIHHLNLQNTVKLMGRINHETVPDILSKSDVFCCLSNSESFGVSILEAMSAGVPVVASDAEGFTEIVEDKIDGIIVPRKNPQKAAEALYLLFENEEYRKSLGIKGKKLVKAKYDWDNCVLNMINIYESIRESNNE